MLIFYADENGDPSMATDPTADPPALRRGTSARFTLAAVGLRDTSRQPVAEALIALKRRHFGESVDRPWADTEIKGRYLFSATHGMHDENPLRPPAGYDALDTPAKVDRFTREVGLLITKYRPLIFAVVVDKLAALKVEPPLPAVGVAYALLHQRIAVAVEDLYGGESAIVVADQQSHHETLFRAGQLHEVRAILSAGLHREPNYNVVLDKPLWVDTDLSIWDREILQLADIAAYSVAEFVARGHAPDEPWYLWPQIHPHLATNFGTGKVIGGGVSVYPRTAARPTE